eukprot:Skav206868  [mRNA]  locus=scaffold898:96900:99833:- [translate_table: standard]
MADRITALSEPSFTLSNSGTIIRTAAICFHLRVTYETVRILTETFLGVTNPVSMAMQLAFAASFLLLWMFLCIRIALCGLEACLLRSLWLLWKELHVVQGAPEVEARWALDVVGVEIIACALIAFSCTTLWWLPYKVLSWAEDQEVADEVLLIPVVVAHRFNHLIKATSVAALSGLLWPCPTYEDKTIEKLEREPRQIWKRSSPAPTFSMRLTDADLWTDKVHELANRGVTLTSLLKFWHLLMEQQVMPSFDPSISTTNDVVRLVTCPCALRFGWHGISESMSQSHPLFSVGQPENEDNLSSVNFVTTTLFDSEAVIPLSQDPSTGEGLTFWAS